MEPITEQLQIHDYMSSLVLFTCERNLIQPQSAFHAIYETHFKIVSFIYCCCCRDGFYIVSALNDKVLEVHKADPKPGAHVLTEKRKEGRELHQLWYCDGQGFIRSKLNDFALEVHGGHSMSTQHICI